MITDTYEISATVGHGFTLIYAVEIVCISVHPCVSVAETNSVVLPIVAEPAPLAEPQPHQPAPAPGLRRIGERRACVAHGAVLDEEQFPPGKDSRYRTGGRILTIAISNG